MAKKCVIKSQCNSFTAKIFVCFCFTCLCLLCRKASPETAEAARTRRTAPCRLRSVMRGRGFLTDIEVEPTDAQSLLSRTVRQRKWLKPQKVFLPEGKASHIPAVDHRAPGEPKTPESCAGPPKSQMFVCSRNSLSGIWTNGIFVFLCEQSGSQHIYQPVGKPGKSAPPSDIFIRSNLIPAMIYLFHQPNLLWR